jgi:hypothetical protein
MMWRRTPLEKASAVAVYLHPYMQGLAPGCPSIQEWVLDHDYRRFALLAAAPFLLCVSLFFALHVMTAITYFIGPVAQYHENSRCYSAVHPEPNPEVVHHYFENGNRLFHSPN